LLSDNRYRRRQNRRHIIKHRSRRKMRRRKKYKKRHRRRYRSRPEPRSLGLVIRPDSFGGGGSGLSELLLGGIKRNGKSVGCSKLLETGIWFVGSVRSEGSEVMWWSWCGGFAVRGDLRWLMELLLAI
jgi:hypothetical protein